MYCEKCKKSYVEVADGVCPVCGEPLADAPAQLQNSELLCAIEQLKQGNQDGFPVVYEHTYKYVYSRAKTLCDSPEDIADIVQEAYSILLQNVASLHSNESIFAWLRTVTFHAGSRILKKKKHETLLTEENEEWLESLPDESADAESDFVSQEDIGIIRDCIKRLPDELRAVILAYYYDNLKVEEIAQLLGIPVGTVKSRLFAARKKIKQYIEEEEHRLGYKLHSFNAVSLLMAIRSLLQENMVAAEVQSATIYTRIYSELSLSAGSGTAISTTVAGTTPTVTVAKAAAGAAFRNATFLGVCKATVAIICGVAIVATAAFAGEHLVRQHGAPGDNDVIVNHTTGTTVQTLDGSITVSSSLDTTYKSTTSPATTTPISAINKTTSTTSQVATSLTSQKTTSTTSVATKDYDPDPTHAPPQPGDVYETEDYIYRYQWVESYPDAEFDPAYVDTSMGWSVLAKNKEQTEYEALFDTIYGKPVTAMFYTYDSCYAMTVAPAVPKYVTHMDFTYIGTSITMAPALPETVIQLGYTFCRTPIAEAPILPSRVESLFNTFCGCKNLKTPPVIPDSVIDMEGAFDGCKNLKTAPVIPENVRDLDATFHGCSSLVTAPVIPENVSGLYETFYGCSSLTGTVVINSKEVYYSGGNISHTLCFQGTEKPITLTGSAPKEILLALAESSLDNDNVTVDV